MDSMTTWWDIMVQVNVSVTRCLRTRCLRRTSRESLKVEFQRSRGLNWVECAGQQSKSLWPHKTCVCPRMQRPRRTWGGICSPVSRSQVTVVLTSYYCVSLEKWNCSTINTKQAQRFRTIINVLTRSLFQLSASLWMKMEVTSWFLHLVQSPFQSDTCQTKVQTPVAPCFCIKTHPPPLPLPPPPPPTPHLLSFLTLSVCMSEMLRKHWG